MKYRWRSDPSVLCEADVLLVNQPMILQHNETGISIVSREEFERLWEPVPEVCDCPCHTNPGVGIHFAACCGPGSVSGKVPPVVEAATEADDAKCVAPYPQVEKLQKERDDLRAEGAADELLLAKRNRLLGAIPGCPVHGNQCVSHAIEWVEGMKRHNESLRIRLTALEAHQLDTDVLILEVTEKLKSVAARLQGRVAAL
jgi:hypothetical protein